MSAEPELPTEPRDLAAELRTVVVPLVRLLRQQTDGRLTATQASVLGTISRLEPVSLSDLAAGERLSLPMISRVVDVLEGEGFVERVGDPDDRRVTLVRIGPGGHDWIEESRDLRDRWLTERLHDLGDVERAAVAAAIPALIRLVDPRP